MIRRLAALDLLLFALNAQGQGSLYKWVDEKGVVHYSDPTPSGTAGEKFKARPQPPLDSAQTPQRGRSWQEQLQDSNEHRFQEEKRQQEEQQKTRQAAEKCQRARYALDSLKRETPLYRVNKDGERTYMEDEERQRLAADWQKQADANCR